MKLYLYKLLKQSNNALCCIVQVIMNNNIISVLETHEDEDQESIQNPDKVVERHLQGVCCSRHPNKKAIIN